MKKITILLLSLCSVVVACKKDTSLEKTKAGDTPASTNGGLQTFTLDDGAMGIPAQRPDGSYQFNKDGVSITLRNVILETNYYYGDPVQSYDMEVENGYATTDAGYFIGHYSQLGTSVIDNVHSQIAKYQKDWKNYVDGAIDSTTMQLKVANIPVFKDYVGSGSFMGTVKGIIIRNPNSPSTLSYANENFALNPSTSFGPFLGDLVINSVQYKFYGKNGVIKRVTKLTGTSEVSVRIENGAYTMINNSTYNSRVTGQLHTPTGIITLNNDITSWAQEV